ncbi:DinB family protein [Desulfosporosinus fructosivorans]|uniref:DinB family protein n=1 Tax=Desulfosporosinus fructosivorans TaxID=2018669 RepID=A0A4Z0R6D5_9FIRM|nr:DinB family protein [Desulfosporosinus fructosivorans]TGE38114.1 DinB family protein [Desulfosporosinus fructosivorans]
MREFLFNQLKVIRSNTINAVKELNESQSDSVPVGFNNNIRWNLGHIYLVQEHFAFGFTQEQKQMIVPDGFKDLFWLGTKPSEWKVHPPTLPELIQVLQDQTNRIEEKLNNRLEETVAKPFTMPSGLTLKTIGEFLTFSMYHEGRHFEIIKMLNRFSE